MALVTLQTIFQDAFPAYEQRHALPAHVRRAAHALMQCRTAALGGHIQACPSPGNSGTPGALSQALSALWHNRCAPPWPKTWAACRGGALSTV
jgi:Transposase zinc-binding domain